MKPLIILLVLVLKNIKGRTIFTEIDFTANNDHLFCRIYYKIPGIVLFVKS